MNKMLEKSNSELKTHLTEILISKLPPLPKTNKSPVIISKDGNVSKLSKQSNILLKDLYSSLANVKVTELRVKPKDPSACLFDEINYKSNDNLQFKYYRKSARKVLKFSFFFKVLISYLYTIFFD